MATSVSGRREGMEGYFRIAERGSSVRTEIIAGVTTFMTMAYILFLNPAILTSLPDRSGTQLEPAAVLTVTALAAGLMTIAMGGFANYPFAIAAGLGLNAVVAFQLVGGQQLTWPEAMGVVFVEGIIILILVLTKFRQAVMDAVPLPLKQAIAVGIGLFITIIGFVDAGFVTSTKQPAPPLQLGTANELRGWPVFIFVIGLLLIIWLYTRRVRGALLLGILITTVLAMIVNVVFLDSKGFGSSAIWQNPVDFPSGSNFDLIGNFSLGFVAKLGVISAVLAVFTIMLSDFFDTMGTAVGLAREANLLEPDGSVPGIDRILVVDSAAAAVGGAFSASSNTTYIESASGVADGARTGLASVATGVLFLIAMFFSPLVQIVPSEAAAPALVIVGALMISQIRHLVWDDMVLVIPAFLTIALMPFTYSITNGIGAGVVSYVLLRVATGRGREVHPLMWGVAALFVVYFALDPIQQLL